MRRRVLHLPGSDDVAQRGVNRLERLAYILSHDRDGNPLPPKPRRERPDPGSSKGPGRDVPTWEQMMATINRAGQRDRRRADARIAREHPPIPLHRQLSLFEPARHVVGGDAS